MASELFRRIFFACVFLLISTVTLTTGQDAQIACNNVCRQRYSYYYRRYCGPRAPRFCQHRQWLTNYVYACYRQCASQASSSTTTSTSAPTSPIKPASLGNITSCGQSPASRIVGGVTAGECEFPWAVVLNITPGTMCGGSILDETHVLTAAHCVTDKTGRVVKSARSVVVKHGSSDQRHMHRAYVANVTVHPGYVKRVFANDIAMLKLSAPLTFDRCTSPICFPDPSENPFASTACTVAGWGTTTFSHPSAQRHLLRVQVPLVSQRTCQRAHGSRIINKSKLCAGDMTSGGKDSCMGDSGGPLMCLSGNHFTLHGVVSFGRGCGSRRYPGVYTKVAAPDINRWILQNM